MPIWHACIAIRPAKHRWSHLYGLIPHLQWLSGRKGPSLWHGSGTWSLSLQPLSSICARHMKILGPIWHMMRRSWMILMTVSCNRDRKPHLRNIAQFQPTVMYPFSSIKACTVLIESSFIMLRHPRCGSFTIPIQPFRNSQCHLLTML